MGDVKHRIEIKTLQKPAPISKEKVSELKGAFSGRLISRMRREGVDCPVKQITVGFVECFTCDSFIRRVRGYVDCNGENAG